jgi:hypothetical protein
MCTAPAPEVVVGSEPQPQPHSGGLTYLQHVASDEDEGGPAKGATTTGAVDATNNNPTQGTLLPDFKAKGASLHPLFIIFLTFLIFISIISSCSILFH